ncbi:alpha/beta hydrolase [Vagococcus fluvialis]|uniref:alpha/beta hydrolase n=1 Tax=Vagococcus fluvialis TaxID=2738 RepID=UPI001A8F7E56|nr:alpha/beta hydrolase-fold protein [Vagococcus fluvialis]MBO0430261.1 alpha/beta hydrolase [Vagococcus fluvialis]
MQTISFEDFFLDVYLPVGFSKETPLNLLYVLDGDAFSPMIAETIKLQMRNSPKTGVWPTIVVGISYHGEATFSRERRFLDFTPEKTKTPLETDIRKDFPDGGGIDYFLEKINRAHQLINQEYTINQDKVGFFGHSLGGLCVLESYFRQALPFVTDYLAISPSLWWEQEAFFERPLKEAFINKNVAITVGEDEGDMVDFALKAKELILTKNLAKRFQFYIAPEENHMSVVFQSISRNLRWFNQHD